MAEFDLDTIETDYVNLLTQREQVYSQLKPVNKGIREIEKKVKSYMKENGVESMILGPNEFTTKTNKRLRISVDDLETLLPEGTDIESYMVSNTSISKKPRREEEQNDN